jgi:hypothetical protein
MKSTLVVWAVDVGSVRKKRLGWCAVSQEKHQVGKEIEELVEGIVEDLSSSRKVVLGFECPLFVPVSDDPQKLTSARKGEGRYPWSAGAGSSVLTTGLTMCVWIFKEIRRRTRVSIRPTVDWTEFTSCQANLFIWEAFVSKSSKTGSHRGDAQVAARTFWSRYPDIIEANAITAEKPYSLVGAALLRAGLTDDLSVLSKPCVVIRGKRVNSE